MIGFLWAQGSQQGPGVKTAGVAIGPGKLDAVITDETGVDDFGGDARSWGFEDIGRVDRQAHVFVPALALGAGADITNARKWVFAVPAIEPVDDQEVVGTVNGDVLGTGIGHIK